MLDVSPDEEGGGPIAQSGNNSPAMKPVPVRTLRSSKLAAMAANINKMTNVGEDEDIDLDSSEDVDDPESKEGNTGTVRLEDILVIPGSTNDTNDEDEDNPANPDDGKKGSTSRGLTNTNGPMNKKTNDSGPEKRSSTGNTETGSTSKSKDLSLSCINPSGISDAAYRLGST